MGDVMKSGVGRMGVGVAGSGVIVVVGDGVTVGVWEAVGSGVGLDSEVGVLDASVVAVGSSVGEADAHADSITLMSTAEFPIIRHIAAS
jgi:hypothetical protein